MADGVPGRITGVHVVVALLVGTLISFEGADEGNLVHAVGQAREEFREEYPVRLGADGVDWATLRRSRLGIKSVKVRHAAAHVKVDAALGRVARTSAWRGRLLATEALGVSPNGDTEQSLRGTIYELAAGDVIGFEK